MSTPKSILISGASVAGPALAWFLLRLGHRVTIVERSPSFRTGGQQIDVTGLGLDIIKLMGLYDRIKAAAVQDDGIKFVDANNRTFSTIPAERSDETKPGIVREIEILRGALAKVLFAEIEDQVTMIYDNEIIGLSEKADGITVNFSNHPDDDFDLVVAADGLGSKTRGIAFGTGSEQYIKSLGQCGAYFTIPWTETDGTFDRWFNAPGSRVILLRPQKSQGVTGAYLFLMTPRSRELGRLSASDGKAEFARLFADAGWETPRVLQGLQNCSDFYAQETAQVHAERLVSGRTVLLGDAGYAPSPITGQGTTLAFIGAYVLAGCLAQSQDDVGSALAAYEKQMRPIIAKSQRLIPGTPAIANPETVTGIWIFNTVLWLVGLVYNGYIGMIADVILKTLVSRLPEPRRQLPEFEVLQAAIAKSGP